MKKIISTTWMTLDGFISGLNNDMGFVGEFFDEAMGKYEGEIIDTADTIILGRLTYESFAGSWPKVPDKLDVSEAEKQYAKKLNAMHKIFFTKSLDKALWNNSEIMREINVEEIKKLKEGSGTDILIYGSASIVQQLTNLGLIDEYQILVHPTILGDGKPLFKDIKQKHLFKLVSSKVFPSGVVLLTYQSNIS